MTPFWSGKVGKAGKAVVFIEESAARERQGDGKARKGRNRTPAAYRKPSASNAPGAHVALAPRPGMV
jgi:hypothetical protein